MFRDRNDNFHDSVAPCPAEIIENGEQNRTHSRFSPIGPI